MNKSDECGVMIDGETLGVNTNAPIVTIAAVFFDLNTSWTLPIHFRLDVQYQLDNGAKADWSTIRWWLQQKRAARNALMESPIECVSPDTFFYALDHYFEKLKPKTVWAKPATADLTWLTSLYEREDVQRPWSYDQERCLRTIIKAHDPHGQLEPKFVGTPHDAKDDAVHQVWYLRVLQEEFNFTLS